MSALDYNEALKQGKKEYHACTYKGRYPYLPVLDQIISNSKIEIRNEQDLGTYSIPLRLVVGTAHEGRTQAFAANFMPIMETGSEFSAKWTALSNSQVNEGIHDPIKVFEFMNRFYVIEGNKRVSVMKYFGAVTIRAEVIRKVPVMSSNPDVQIYYEFMEFFECTHMNDIYFSKPGSFKSLMNLVGIKPGEEMDEIARENLVSSFLRFANAFKARGGDRFSYPTADAYLRLIHIQNYDEVVHYSPKEMAKYVAKYWSEFELLDEAADTAVELKLNPEKVTKKNLLSYLIPGGLSVDKLKVGFVYEFSPQDSQWVYGHELGRKYLEDVFNNELETFVEENIRPGVNDDEAIEALIYQGCNLIFVTSSTMVLNSVKEAIAHPDVKILNCSLDASHEAIRTYFARMYEAKFLSGLIAGALTKTNKIGFVAGSPVRGTLSDINAFARGAKMVNPEAVVYVEWTGVKDSNYDEAFHKYGVDIVSDQDMITPGRNRRQFGLYQLKGDRSVHLAMTLWHWGNFYQQLIESIVNGSWDKQAPSGSVRSLNYWWGLSAEAIEFIMSDNVPKDTRRLVEIIRDSIIQERYHIFSGELKNQNGEIVSEEGEELTPEEIISMDYLLENVIGRLPKYEELNEPARIRVMEQGVIGPED